MHEMDVYMYDSGYRLKHQQSFVNSLNFVINVQSSSSLAGYRAHWWKYRALWWHLFTMAFQSIIWLAKYQHSIHLSQTSSPELKRLLLYLVKFWTECVSLTQNLTLADSCTVKYLFAFFQCRGVLWCWPQVSKWNYVMSRYIFFDSSVLNSLLTKYSVSLEVPLASTKRRKRIYNHSAREFVL